MFIVEINYNPGKSMELTINIRINRTAEFFIILCGILIAYNN